MYTTFKYQHTTCFDILTEMILFNGSDTNVNIIKYVPECVFVCCYGFYTQNIRTLQFFLRK